MSKSSGCIPLRWSGSGSVIKITRIMVHQRNRWILVQRGFSSRFHVSWSEWSRSFQGWTHPISLLVRYTFGYISLPSPQNNSVKWSNSSFFWRTWAHNGEFFILFLNVRAVPTNNSSWMVGPHCTSRASLNNNREIVQITRTITRWNNF